MFDDRTQHSVLDALARERLYAFLWRAFDILHPGGPFLPAWHIEAMAYHLEQVVRGECRRLLITIGPRYLKSITTSVALPAWWLGRDPSIKIMVASYGSDLSAKHARDCRTLMASDMYRRLYPHVKIDPQRNTAEEFMTTARGGRKAVSLGGAVTGFGADVLIVDDLMKATDAHSAVERQRAKTFYDETLFSRLNDKRDGAIIAIQQRLHEDDIASYLLDKGFTHLNLRAIAEEDAEHPVSLDRVYRRRQGEALCEAREPLETLCQIRDEIGGPAFSAQYQQNPVPPDGNQLRWERFGTYDEAPPRDELLAVIQSWDTAYSSLPSADFSACVTLGLRQDLRWLILDGWRGRLEYPELKDKIRELQRRWKADQLLIEHAGAGITLIAEFLRSGVFSRNQLFGYQPTVPKDVRFAVLTDKIQDQKILCPVDAPWLPIFRHELKAFPNGRNDDQADALAQFADWVGTFRAEYRVATIRNGGVPPRRNFIRR